MRKLIFYSPATVKNESSAPIEDRENPQKQIEALKNVIHMQAAEIIRLRDEVLASTKQRSGVSKGAPADNTNDLAREFELKGPAMEERELQLEEQFKQLNTQENLSDFVDKYSKMEEEITSLKNIIKKQNEKINWLNAHCMRLSNSNVLQSMEVDRLEDRLRCRSKEWAEDDEENNTAQVSKNSKQVVPGEIAGFDNPFNCGSSCGFGVVFFIWDQMEFELCNGKLIGEIWRKGNNEAASCTSSLNYLVGLGLLEKKELFTKEINEVYSIEMALKDAHEKMKDQSRPAVLALEYKEKTIGHCVAIMPDGSTVIDVQNKRYYNPLLDEPISKIHVVNVKENPPEDWIEKYGLDKCKVNHVPRVQDPGYEVQAKLDL